MVEEVVKKEQERERKIKERADILYGKDEEYYKKFPHRNYRQFDDNITGAAADIKSYNKQYINKLQNMAQTTTDKNFLNSLNHILEVEGGYNNIIGDVPTNLGVTQGIYNIYRNEQKLPVQSVKNIKIEEAVPIYYKYFWKPSGAEKLSHPLDLVYFDMFVNSNPRDAKRVLNRSNNDVYKFLDNRKNFYNDVIKDKPIKEKFRKGWYNRLEKLKKYVDEYYEKSG